MLVHRRTPPLSWAIVAAAQDAGIERAASISAMTATTTLHTAADRVRLETEHIP